MLSGITITCFAASYLVTLSLEVSRLFFRVTVRYALMISFAAAGVLAHALFLYSLSAAELRAGRPPLSSWYDWCLVAAWVIAAAYLAMAVRKPRDNVGLFLLPPVLALVGLAFVVRDAAPFERQQASSYWAMIHGVALLLGTVAVTLGFAAGVMYLVQAYRLKHKLPPRPGFRLPSLEGLQHFNARSLVLSTALLAIGLISGIVLNLIRQASQSLVVEWTDPVVLSSAVLFLWLMSSSLFEWLYKPARQGRKVAYLTLASFVFLCLALAFVLWGQHGSSSREQEEEARTPHARSAEDWG